MKDQLTTVLEAIRLTQHILDEYSLQAGPRDHNNFLTRVIAVIEDEKLVSAVRLLDPPSRSDAGGISLARLITV